MTHLYFYQINNLNCNYPCANLSTGCRFPPSLSLSLSLSPFLPISLFLKTISNLGLFLNIILNHLLEASNTKLSELDVFSVRILAFRTLTWNISTILPEMFIIIILLVLVKLAQ